MSRINKSDIAGMHVLSDEAVARKFEPYCGICPNAYFGCNGARDARTFETLCCKNYQNCPQNGALLATGIDGGVSHQ